MKKLAADDKFIAVVLVSLLISMVSFCLVWLDIWQGAKLIFQIAVPVGAGTVVMGVLKRLR